VAIGAVGVVAVVMAVGDTDALLGLDVIVVLDVALAGELNPPVSLDVVVAIPSLVTVPVGDLYFNEIFISTCQYSLK